LTPENPSPKEAKYLFQENRIITFKIPSKEADLFYI